MNIPRWENINAVFARQFNRERNIRSRSGMLSYCVRADCAFSNRESLYSEDRSRLCTIISMIGFQRTVKIIRTVTFIRSPKFLSIVQLPRRLIFIRSRSITFFILY